MRDLYSNVKTVEAFVIAAISSDTTTAGVEVDLLKYDSCLFVAQAGTVTDGTYTPLIQESDTSGSYSGSVADTDLIGTEAAAVLSATSDIKKIGYKGSKRYVKLSYVSASTTSGGTVGASAILGNPSDAPVA
tara:strand:+ start:4466 stop:4861 length:396 start_codon:yes stop_codon:yes gene_type:complete